MTVNDQVPLYGFSLDILNHIILIHKDEGLFIHVTKLT